MIAKAPWHFAPNELRNLPGVISAPRFATYLRARENDREGALALYRWNLEVSAAFVGSLHLCEIAVRNGIVDTIEAVNGGAWPWTQGFIRSIPTGGGYDAQRDLRNCAARNQTSGMVVADLKLTLRFERQIWQHHFAAALPGHDTALSVSDAIAACRDDLEHVRLFRNRIAHHEPIFARNLQDDFGCIRRLVHWRNPSAAAWMAKIETVTPLIQTLP